MTSKAARRAADRLLGRGGPGHAYLAVCLVVKDQNEDIREWVKHHVQLGVGKVYVFDDNSSTPAVTMMEDFIDSGGNPSISN
jgi:hypothetical protein